MMVVLAGVLLAIPAQAALVQVEVTGEVEWNFLRAFPLNEAQAGDPGLVFVHGRTGDRRTDDPGSVRADTLVRTPQ